MPNELPNDENHPENHPFYRLGMCNCSLCLTQREREILGSLDRAPVRPAPLPPWRRGASVASSTSILSSAYRGPVVDAVRAANRAAILESLGPGPSPTEVPRDPKTPTERMVGDYVYFDGFGVDETMATKLAWFAWAENYMEALKQRLPTRQVKFAKRTALRAYSSSDGENSEANVASVAAAAVWAERRLNR